MEGKKEFAKCKFEVIMPPKRVNSSTRLVSDWSNALRITDIALESNDSANITSEVILSAKTSNNFLFSMPNLL